MPILFLQSNKGILSTLFAGKEVPHNTSKVAVAAATLPRNAVEQKRPAARPLPTPKTEPKLPVKNDPSLPTTLLGTLQKKYNIKNSSPNVVEMFVLISCHF